jgi:hypothetical protein
VKCVAMSAPLEIKTPPLAPNCLVRDCIAHRSCIKMTPRESRHVRLAAGLAAASLVLIAIELLLHYAIGHPLVRRPSL